MKLTLDQRIDLAEKRVQSLRKSCARMRYYDAHWERQEREIERLEKAEAKLEALRKARDRMTG